MKIPDPTEEHKKHLPEYISKWQNIGSNNDPCDVEAFKKGVKKAYEAAGFSLPKIFIGPFNNPLETTIAGVIVFHIFNGIEDEKCVNPAQLNPIVEEIFNTVFDETIKQIRAQGVDLFNLEGLKIGATNKLKEKYFDFLNAHIYGNIDAGWLASYDFIENVMGSDNSISSEDLAKCKKMHGLMEIAKSAGWWIPMRDVVIFMHRQLEIHLDSQRRLHNETGPAVRFRGHNICDIYSIHGVKVSKKIIDRQFTWEDIDKEENAEVRRIMINFYGSVKYIQDSGITPIHSDDFGTLYKKDVPDDEPIMVVKVVNSTPEPDGSFKDYFISVDPNAYGGLKTAHDAVASTWRHKKDGSLVFHDPKNYDPEIQT